MVRLSETERIEILMMLGYRDRRRSLQDVCNLFNTAHPNRNRIYKSVVGKTLKRFEQTGSVKDLPKIGRPRTSRSEDKQLDVVLAVTEDPHLPTRNEKYKLYKVQLVHELTVDRGKVVFLLPFPRRYLSCEYGEFPFGEL